MEIIKWKKLVSLAFFSLICCTFHQGMLTFYLNLLQGNLLYEEVKFTVD